MDFSEKYRLLIFQANYINGGMFIEDLSRHHQNNMLKFYIEDSDNYSYHDCHSLIIISNDNL
jgi:hypothetical protein